MTTNRDLLNKWEECKVLIQSKRAKEALDYLYFLADEGIDYAMLEIGNIFESGIGDVDQDIPAALHWYERAFEATEDPEAVLRIARIYMFGPEAKRDYQKARDLYSLDLISDNAIALLNLGLMHDKGWGADENIETAISYYKKAIDKESIFANVYLAQLYWRKKCYLRAIVTRIKASIITIVGLFVDGAKYSEKIRRY